VGGEKLESKRNEVDMHKQDGFLGKGEKEAVEKRKQTMSDAGSRARKQQRGKGIRGKEDRRTCDEKWRKVPAQPQQID
jgi:hypothetical protein